MSPLWRCSSWIHPPRWRWCSACITFSCLFTDSGAHRRIPLRSLRVCCLCFCCDRYALKQVSWHFSWFEPYAYAWKHWQSPLQTAIFLQVVRQSSHSLKTEMLHWYTYCYALTSKAFLSAQASASSLGKSLKRFLVNQHDLHLFSGRKVIGLLFVDCPGYRCLLG